MVPAVLDPIPGCIYDSFTFPQGNRTLLTVMMGGAWYDQVIGDKSEVEVERMATRSSAPVYRSVHGGPRVEADTCEVTDQVSRPQH